MAFAFELILDQESDQRIRLMWDEFQRAGIPSYADRAGYRPGIILGMFHQVNVEAARMEIRKFVLQHSAIDIHVADVGQHVEQTISIFGEVEKSPDLAAVHTDAHQFLKKVGMSPRPEYLVANWKPRLMLAEGLGPSHIPQIAPYVAQMGFPFKAVAVGVALTQINPMRLQTIIEGSFEGGHFRDRT